MLIRMAMGEMGNEATSGIPGQEAAVAEVSREVKGGRG